MPELLGNVVGGVFGTSDIFTDQRKYDKDKSKFFVWRERGFAPMVHVLITALDKVTVSDPEPKHFEDGYRTLAVPLTGLTISALSGTAPEFRDITFTTGDPTAANYVGNFQVGQVWENSHIFMSNTANPTFNLTRSQTVYNKHETMEVTAVNASTGVVTFRRHLGTDTQLGTSVAPATTHTLYLHAIASTDGAGAPTSFSQNPVVVNNYIQDFKEPYEITDIAAATDIFGENEWQRKARNARRNFDRQLERAFLGGHMYKRTDAANNQQKWFTGGAEEWVPLDTDHQITFNSLPPTLTLMNTNLKTVFFYGSQEKWGFCGYGALTKVSNAAADKIRYNDVMSKNIGLEVNDFTTAAGGVLHLVPDFEMSQTNKDNEIFVVDIAYMKYMYMQGKDIHIDKGKNGTGLQTNDETKTKHQIRGTLGAKRTFKDSHFHLYDLG